MLTCYLLHYILREQQKFFFLINLNFKYVLIVEPTVTGYPQFLLSIVSNFKYLYILNYWF